MHPATWHKTQARVFTEGTSNEYTHRKSGRREEELNGWIEREKERKKGAKDGEYIYTYIYSGRCCSARGEKPEVESRGRTRAETSMVVLPAMTTRPDTIITPCYTTVNANCKRNCMVNLQKKKKNKLRSDETK